MSAMFSLSSETKERSRTTVNLGNLPDLSLVYLLSKTYLWLEMIKYRPIGMLLFRTISLAVVLLFISDFIFGQHLNFNHYSRKDGYADQAGFDLQMIQDQSGFLWIPTLNGLYRFDGREFRAFQYDSKNPFGLNTNITRALYQDRFGKIWIGTTGGGINIFDPETGVFEHLLNDPKNPESLCGNDVRSIHEDQDGNIWVGAFPELACVCDPEERLFKRKYQPVGDLSFLQTSDGTIWRGGGMRFSKYLPERDTFVNINHPDNIEQYGSYIITDMAEWQGEIWHSSKRFTKGIFNSETEKFSEFPPSISRAETQYNSHALFKDRSGNFWFGGHSGVARYNPAEDKYWSYFHDAEKIMSCQSGVISSIFEDRAGSIWLSGFEGSGLSVIHNVNSPVEMLSLPYVKDLIQLDEQYLLLNTALDGNILFDFYKNKVIPNGLPKILKTTETSFMRMGPNKELWWSDFTDNKTYGLNLDTKALYTVETANRFEVDSKGNLWFVQPFYYDRQKEEVIEFEDQIIAADNSEIRRGIIYYQNLVDDNDQIWFGGNQDGLVKYAPSTKDVEFFKNDPDDPNSIVSGSVNLLFQGANGWIYTLTGNGLSIYQEEKNRFVNFEIAEGLPQNSSFPIIEDKHQNVWLGTTSHLIKININDLSIHKFDESDGIPFGTFDEFSARDSLGRLYLSKEGGIFRFHPDSLRLDTTVVPIILTDFFLNHKPIRPGQPDSLLKKNIQYLKEIKLKHTQSDFGFRFVSPNFIKAGQIQYFYKLENYDKDWVDIGNKLEVYFTNIPAGTYRFRVKAKTASGYWTELKEGIQIKISPAWWNTYWFYLLCVLLITGIVFAWIYRLRLERNKLEKEVEIRTSEVLKTQDQLFLQDKLASLGQLTAGIAHEIKNPLNFVNNFSEGNIEMLEELQVEIDKYKDKLSGEDYQEISTLIRDIRQNELSVNQNGKRADRIVRSMMDHARGTESTLQTVDINQLIDDNTNLAYHSYRALEPAFNVRIERNFDQKIDLVQVYPEELGRVFINILNNACHALLQKQKTAGGDFQPTLSITTKSESEHLEINIQDNGLGIPLEIREKIFTPFFTTKASTEGNTGLGLSISFDIIQRHKGSIEIESEAGHFTNFIIKLPTNLN